jgi:phosphoribulokinase
MDKKHLIGIFLFIILLFIIYFSSRDSTVTVVKEHFAQLETYYFKDENNELKSRSQHITKYNKSDKGKYTLYKFDKKESLIQYNKIIILY